jgi:hypothetical protein
MTENCQLEMSREVSCQTITYLPRPNHPIKELEGAWNDKLLAAAGLKKDY